MCNEELLEKINKCKSYTEMVNTLFGLNYYNGYAKKLLFDFCNENNINPEDIIIKNKPKPRFCLECGKIITNKDNKKFCSSRCAAKYNNRHRKVSEETKKKISNALLLRSEKSGNKHNEITNKILYKHVCVTCGKEYYSTHKKGSHCSRKCICEDENYIKKLRTKANERVNNGTHKGWNSRNISSYPETFWVQVLNNNNISFKRECHENGKYFLDFKIEKNGKLIDLEIDGKQHKISERKNSDIVRDDFLKKLGYIVYRIEWNEINSEEGSLRMKEKINKFINFYNNL